MITGPDKPRLCLRPLRSKPTGRALASAGPSPARALVWAALLGALWCAPAQAFDVRIGARTKMTAEVHAEGTRVTVDGHLRDNIGQGIEGKSVALAFKQRGPLGPVAREARTDRTGRFYLAVSLDPGVYDVDITYGGQEHYFSRSVLESVVTCERGAVLLSLQVPEFVLKGADTVLVRVAATNGASPVPDLPLSVEIGGQRVEIPTGAEGTASVPLRLGEVTDPSVPIRVSFEGSRAFAEAAAATTLRVLDGPWLSVEARNVRARLDRGVRVKGQVEDRYGAVAGGVVDVLMTQKGAEVGRYSVRSKDDGGYDLFVAEDRLEQGRLDVRARLTIEGQSVESESLTLEVNKTGQGLLPWLLAIILGVCVAVLAGFAIRDGVRGWMRRKPPERRPRQTMAGARAPAIIPIPAGEVPAEVARSPQDIAGILWDNQIKAPIEGGEVTLRRAGPGQGEEGEPDFRAFTGSDGEFAFVNLDAGPHVLRVQCRGYISASYRFEVPHGGRLRWFRFPMTPVRVVVRDLYEQMVEDVASERESWGRLTPRQASRLLLRAVEASVREPFPGGQEGVAAFKARLEQVLEASRGEGSLTPEALIAAVVSVLEEVYFSQRRHDEALATIMERLTQEVRKQVSVEAMEEGLW